MKNLFYLFVCVSLFASCADGDKKTDNSAETLKAEKVECICLWDGVSIREEAAKKGKYISSVSLGEKVTFLGETKIDSLDKNREYIKIELSDGTVGWSTKTLYAIDAYAAAINDFAPIFKRPDILTTTEKKFEKMDIVAVVSAKDDWVEVQGNQKKLKGWIKKQAITTNAEDIAVCVLVEKKLKKGSEIKVEEIEAFLEELPYKNSQFISLLNDLNNEYKTELESATEETEEVIEEAAITQ